MTAATTHLRTPRPMDYAGRSIGPLRLARAMTVNILGGVSILTALAILWPNAAITVIFLQEHLGASKTEIGLNLTLVTLSTVACLPGAWLFSRLQRRRRVWVPMTAAARMFMFGPVLILLLSRQGGGSESGVQGSNWLFWAFAFSLFLVNLGSVFTSPGWWSWMGDLIPESTWGSFFGRRFRWMLFAQSLAALVAGAMLDRAGSPEAERTIFLLLFSVAAVLAVADPLLFWAIPEPVRPAPPRRTLREVVGDYLEPVRDPAFRRLLLGAGAYGFFANLAAPFFVLFLRGEDVVGVWIGGRASMALLSLVTVVFAASTALAANAWGRLADRIGHRIVWILCCAGYFSHAILFFVNETNYAWLGLVYAALFGLLSAGQLVAVQNLALSMAPARRREYHVAAFQSAIALASALAPVLGGWLADRYRVLPGIPLPGGQPASYIHLLLAIAFAGILLALPVMLRVPDPKGSLLLPWVGRLLSGDLLRTSWSMGVFATASSAPRQLRALRSIRSRDGNVLLPDISEALEDADLQVRREALLALGRLGTPEALDLLRWYLHEPDALMRAPSVEAIAHTRVPDRSTLLKRALRDPDRQVRRAAAEALGTAGHPEVADELRVLLTREEDGEVLVSAAVALSRMKEFGAVREMLHLALHSDNRTVRLQMVVALADLLTGTSDFPSLWRHDRRWRGSGFAKLARKLRRQARTLSRMGQRVKYARRERKQLIAAVDDRLDVFLDHVESEDWTEALAALETLVYEFLRLRYRYEGTEGDALEFLSAVSPAEAQRHWLIVYLCRTCDQPETADAPWEALTLLATHVLVHSEPPF